MAGMQQIETAVGEADVEATGPPAFYIRRCHGCRDYFVLRCGQIGGQDAVGQFIAANHRRAHFANHYARGQIG